MKYGIIMDFKRKIQGTSEQKSTQSYSRGILNYFFKAIQTIIVYFKKLLNFV